MQRATIIPDIKKGDAFMGQLVLLLLIAGAIVLFAISNLSPIALVILGISTPALPLAFWVLGALLAGIVTTLLLSGFSSLASGAAVRRANQPTRDARSPWTDAREAEARNPRDAAGFRAAEAERTARNAESSIRDDWNRNRDEWDDWGSSSPSRSNSDAREARSSPRQASQASQTSQTSQTNIRDRINEVWPQRGGYERGSHDRGGESNRSPGNPRTPRTSETRQAPPAADTAYSGRAGRREDIRKPEVYDAEYRVLIPPYNPADAQAPPASPPAAPSDTPKDSPKDAPKDAPKPPTNSGADSTTDDEDWI